MSRTRFFFHLCVVVIAIFAIAASTACKSSSNSAPVEKPIAAASPQAPAPAATAFPKLPPPTETEVKAAFARVFGSDLVSQFGPHDFIVGDFNGDQSEDIAIIARAAPGKLGEVNSEVADWIIQDADKAFIPPSGKRVVIPQPQQRPQVAQDEEVLAIIHGFGPQGWRNPDARQAYLVKHAAAKLVGTTPSISQRAIRAMKLPVETDVIKQVRNNKKGFLFWTGGNYAWHPSES